MHTALRPSRKQNKDESSLRASSLRGREGGRRRCGAGGKEGESYFRFFPVSHPHPRPPRPRELNRCLGRERNIVSFAS